MARNNHLLSPVSESAKLSTSQQQYSPSLQSLFSDSDGRSDLTGTAESVLFSDDSILDMSMSSEFSYLLRILSVHLVVGLDSDDHQLSEGREITSYFKHYRSFRSYCIFRNNTMRGEKVEVFSSSVHFGNATTCLFHSDEPLTSLHVREFPVTSTELKLVLAKNQQVYPCLQLRPLLFNDGHHEISILDALESTESRISKAGTLLNSHLDSLFTLASRHAESIITFFCNSCDRISAAASEIATLIQMTQGAKTTNEVIDYCLDFSPSNDSNLAALVAFLESTMTMCTQIDERIGSLQADVSQLRALFENFGDSSYRQLDQTKSIFERLDTIYMEYIRCEEEIDNSNILCYSPYCEQMEWLSIFSNKLSLSNILADLLRVFTDSDRLRLLLPDIMEHAMHLQESIRTNRALEVQIH